ncbi:MAG: DUF368 domain-containing protein [Anaerolineae bacterium]|nr:DUF368 domain-containing protein [Anaerolineae bacterium]
MGAADVVPGVSGGTMAFILGIYDELLHAIHAVDLTFVRRLAALRWREAFAGFPWRFLLALGTGILLAVFTLAEGLSWLLHHHPALVWAFFFGLVLASIFVVRRKVQRWRPALVALMLAAAVGMFALIGAAPLQTPEALWFYFLSGFVAVCAMILPGISGAFILVLMGKYTAVLDAVVRLDVIRLAVVAAGCVAGLMSFVRLLRYLLRRWHDAVIAALMGIMLGSLRKVWPWKAAHPAASDGWGHETLLLPEMSVEAGASIVLMLLGALLVLTIDRLAARRAARGLGEV